MYLKSWWSKTYNRPLKDPVLASYTKEELIYEYYDNIQRRKAEEERIESDNDMIEESKLQADSEWADEMEKEEEAAGNKKSDSDTMNDPLSDPKNVEWMEKVMEEEKKKHGPDFGEDLSLSFEDK